MGSLGERLSRFECLQAEVKAKTYRVLKLGDFRDPKPGELCKAYEKNK